VLVDRHAGAPRGDAGGDGEPLVVHAVIVREVHREPDPRRQHGGQAPRGTRRERRDPQPQTALPARARGERPRVGGVERHVEDAVAAVLDVEPALRLQLRDPPRIAPAALDAEAQYGPGMVRLGLRRHHARRGPARLTRQLAPLDEHRAEPAARQLACHRAAHEPSADDDDVGCPRCYCTRPSQ
jgi:hypothetical protein